jgi:hypothetical protein
MEMDVNYRGIGFFEGENKWITLIQNAASAK